MDWRSQAPEQDNSGEAPSRGLRHSSPRTIFIAVRDLHGVLLLVASVGGVICLLFIGGILGGRLIVGFLMGVFLTGGLGFFFWRYGDSAKLASRLMLLDTAHTEQAQYPALRLLQQRLEIGFLNVGSNEGQSALRDLNNGWEQLERLLQARKATDSLSLGHLASLAHETYERGLGVLNDALLLMASSGFNERKRLEWEITRIKEHDNASKDDAERHQIRRDTLSLHEQRLHLLDQFQLWADRLVYQARRCEASLQQTRVDIAAMRLDGTGQRIDDVVEALNGTIQEVKEVHEELKRLGY